MKTRNWILVISLVLVLATLVVYAKSGFSTANANSRAPVGMGDFRKFEWSQQVRVGIGDLQKFEADQIRVNTIGMGDLHKFEAEQIPAKAVGMGDLHRFEAGQ